MGMQNLGRSPDAAAIEFFVGFLYVFAIVKRSVNKFVSGCERIVGRADKLGDLLRLVRASAGCLHREISVSDCGNLDSGGCLPYPHPLIIRVLSNTEKTVLERH